MSTDEIVAALRSLVIFGVDQAGAYRELFAPVAEHIGRGVPTRLGDWVSTWATSADPGVVVLTGNAGTGKTATAEEFCRALGEDLPSTDEVVEIHGALVAKDMSGIRTRTERAA